MADGKQYHSFLDNQCLSVYLGEISTLPLLKPSEEVQLAIRIREGDRKALARLIQANLRFVVSIAKDYQNQGLPISDLINEGNIGLMKAAEKFDESKGFKFISYAVWWIRQGITQALADHARSVRLPLNKITIVQQVIKTYHLLEQEFEREPTFQEIADKLNIKPTQVITALVISGKNISLDAPVKAGSENSILELTDFALNTNEEPLIKESLREEISKALRSLSFKEADILRMYFGLNDGEPKTLEEISHKYRLTRERVRQIKERALIRLRHQSRSKFLREFLA
jgi:RNA polymerase primary sigma factor